MTTSSIWRQRYWRGLGRVLWFPLLQKGSCHQCPEQRNLPVLLHLILHLHPNWKGLCSLRSGSWYQEGGHCHPQVCSSGHRWPKNTTSGRCIYTWGFAHGNPVGPHCLGVTISDHITYPGNWWDPLPPSGPEHHQDVPTRHFLPGTTATLSEDQGTLSDHNTPLDSGMTPFWRTGPSK